MRRTLKCSLWPDSSARRCKAQAAPGSTGSVMLLHLGLQQRDAVAVAVVRHDLPRLLRDARHLHRIHVRCARLRATQRSQL